MLLEGEACLIIGSIFLLSQFVKIVFDKEGNRIYDIYIVSIEGT